MTTIPRASAEVILSSHPGIQHKSPNITCVTDLYFDPARGTDSGPILDSTIGDETETHNTGEGHLMVYRECGKTACKQEIGMVLNADGQVLDAKPFSAPCTGKL